MRQPDDPIARLPRTIAAPPIDAQVQPAAREGQQAYGRDQRRGQQPAQLDLVAQAEREGWRRLAMGDRVARCGLAMVGTPYKGFTLEIDNHIECPSVNFQGLDCWTFFETAMGLARMLEVPKERYEPVDLLREIKYTRYRNGRCTGDRAGPPGS